jgi:hypothetical protein
MSPVEVVEFQRPILRTYIFHGVHRDRVVENLSISHFLQAGFLESNAESLKTTAWSGGLSSFAHIHGLLILRPGNYVVSALPLGSI